jgi:hypothetical protein
MVWRMFLDSPCRMNVKTYVKFIRTHKKISDDKAATKQLYPHNIIS